MILDFRALSQKLGTQSLDLFLKHFLSFLILLHIFLHELLFPFIIIFCIFIDTLQMLNKILKIR
jgi:hypothetical protein